MGISLSLHLSYPLIHNFFFGRNVETLINLIVLIFSQIVIMDEIFLVYRSGQSLKFFTLNILKEIGRLSPNVVLEFIFSQADCFQPVKHHLSVRVMLSLTAIHSRKLNIFRIIHILVHIRVHILVHILVHIIIGISGSSCQIRLNMTFSIGFPLHSGLLSHHGLNIEVLFLQRLDIRLEPGVSILYSRVVVVCFFAILDVLVVG